MDLKNSLESAFGRGIFIPNRLGKRGLIVQGFTISPAVEPNTNIAEEGTFKRGLGTPSG